MTSNDGSRTITRRGMLVGGIAGAAACLSTGKTLGATAGELYVFPCAQGLTTVVAVTFPQKTEKSEIQIHAGPQLWSVEVPNADSTEWRANGCRILSGGTAVVIEAPTRMLSTGMLGVWAERFTHGGSRRRIGSPFLAELVSGNPALSDLYHSSSPADDKAVLTARVAQGIAERAREFGQFQNPERHGLRLASILLPDVLRYDPNLPAGFTFAAQNGRHPEEASDVVVKAILYGATTLLTLQRSTWKIDSRISPERTAVARIFELKDYPQCPIISIPSSPGRTPASTYATSICSREHPEPR
jgi:hypothetical protein